MKRLRIFLVLVLLMGSVPVLPACNPPVTVVTPAGQAAYTANEVLRRVERLQDAALAAHKNGTLPLDTTRAVVFATVNIAEIADAATQGWQALARQAWTQAKNDLAVLRPGGELAVAAAVVDELLGGGVK